jgi:hypothetical protein
MTLTGSVGDDILFVEELIGQVRMLSNQDGGTVLESLKQRLY